MFRTLALAVATLALVASASLADPGARVVYVHGVPQIHLDGDYALAVYTVYRSEAAAGPFAPITRLDVTCLGPCFVEDANALPGHSYWYRFELLLRDGTPETFGPFEVAISPTLARLASIAISPNPVRAVGRIDIRLAGIASQGPVPVTATLHDVQGRLVRRVFAGSLPRGGTSISWDGRSDAGRPLPAGAYLLRLVTPLGTSVTRLVQSR